MKRVLIMLLMVVSFANAWSQENETFVLIDTSAGKIKVKLYNETPLHRDNFLKLVNEQRYNGTLFHRVIKQFMIQGGDLNSVGASLDTPLGEDTEGETIPAEIIYPQYYHKRGTLAAARTGDELNPEKASSHCQFYIVTGKFYTAMELDKMERENGTPFTPEHREDLMKVGGYPQLDGKYTVFGEVVSGMKVVEKIELMQTNEANRPLKNVVIRSMQITDK